MKINISKLGIIQEAQIQLKPFTVFIGENGTGKTWAAYTLAGIFGPYGYAQYLESYLEGRTEFQYPSIEEAITQVIEKGNAKINLVEFVQKYAEIYFNQIAKTVPQWINSFMATKRAHFGNMQIQVELSEEVKQKMLNAIRTFQRKTERAIAVKKGSSLFALNALKERDSDELYYYITSETQNLKNNIPQPIIDKEVKKFVVFETFRIINIALFPNICILPTERTTFITFHFHPIQDEDAKKHKKDTKIKDDEMVMLSEPVGNFLTMIGSSLKMFSERKTQEMQDPNISKFIVLANFLERDILQGSLSFEEHGSQVELVYNPEENTQLELNISSSMVKELAPLALYLRYLAKPGDLLVIDEPEMNLHPAAQAEMTEFLGMLVNAGLNVLITTHSPYILDHLNNLIHAKQSDKPEELTPYFFLGKEDAFISKDDLSVYLFEDHTAKSLLSENGEINWQTFSDVSRNISHIYSKIIE